MSPFPPTAFAPVPPFRIVRSRRAGPRAGYRLHVAFRLRTPWAGPYPAADFV